MMTRTATGTTVRPCLSADSDSPSGLYLIKTGALRPWLFLMGLALLTLCLLCTPPAHAQGGYPGGGSGYPGGGSGSGYPGDGSGGGTPPDPGHYWKITYSSSGHITYAIPDTPIQGQSTPQSDPWDSTSSGGGLESETNINGDVLCKVTATLTWIPAAGQAPHSDPPPKKVFINETGIAEESPSIWGAPFDDPFDGPTPGGSADDGLGDSPVPFNYGYSSSGTHLVEQDGSSGTITLGPFTLTAINPVSAWLTDISGFPIYEIFYWNWMGGLCEVGLSVEVVPPPYPVNFRCTSAITYFDGILHYQYSWESSTGKLADLAVSKCTIKERISYEGNSSGQDFYDENGNLVAYLYPLPFDEFHVNPEIGEVVPGADGVLGDDHNIPVISEPYQYASFLTTQNYIYTDDTMDPNNPNDFITLRGPLEIVRTIWAPDINWVYDVIKYDSPEGLSGYLEASKILGPVYPQFGP